MNERPSGCDPHGRGEAAGCARCGAPSAAAGYPLNHPEGLQPHRVLPRHRGDRVAQAMGIGRWQALGHLGTADLGWPNDRRC